MGIIFGILSFIYHVAIEIGKATLEFLKTTNGKITVVVVVIIAMAIIFQKVRTSIKQKKELLRLREFEEQEYRRRQEAINTISPSANREDYLIESDDYRRGNSKENFYRKTYVLRLLEAFDNCCAKCGDNENGVDIDHFIFSKNEGGCFIMKHKDGHLVNNAIPLCRTCNRGKSDIDYRLFFTDEELMSVFRRNLSMTKYLNEKSIFDVDGKILKQKKTA